jgi:type VI secretion system protein ImpE
MQSEQSLHQGNPEEALTHLQAQVRKEPANSKLRVFLFQLLAVLGRWERALNQLNVAGELDNANLLMVQTYREAIQYFVRPFLQANVLHCFSGTHSNGWPYWLKL